MERSWFSQLGVRPGTFTDAIPDDVYNRLNKRELKILDIHGGMILESWQYGRHIIIFIYLFILFYFILILYIYILFKIYIII